VPQTVTQNTRANAALGEGDRHAAKLVGRRRSEPFREQQDVISALAEGRGDLDEAKAEIAEAIKLDPKVNSLAALSASAPWITNPPLWALRQKTVNVGLRRAGFPDE
jgi:hypothetical protein